MDRQELGFLLSAHHLTMLYISIKFRENVMCVCVCVCVCVCGGGGGGGGGATT